MNQVKSPLPLCLLTLLSPWVHATEQPVDPEPNGAIPRIAGTLPLTQHKTAADDSAIAVDIHGYINNGERQPWNTYRHSLHDISDRSLVGGHFEDNLRPWSLAWSADKSTLYGISREDQQRKLLAFDPQTGLSTTIASLSGHDAATVAITGMAIDQDNNCFMIGLDRANHDTISTLYRCDLMSGQLTLLGAQSDAPDLHDIVATCDGALYGVDSFQGAFYQLDKSNGSASLVGSLGIPSSVGLFNVTYDRKHDRVIQYVHPEGQSHFTAMAEINQQTGDATFIDDQYILGSYVGASESSCDEQDAGFDINTAFNGSWYNPMTDGQGFVFDVLPDSDFFYGAWFTYADQASQDASGQRWMTAQGPLGSGNSVQLSLLNSTGGVFDDSAQVDTVVVGEMTITFDDCSTGTVSYNLDNGAQTGTFTIQRIAGDQVAYCESLINAGIK